jgi:hypothetical protein
MRVIRMAPVTAVLAALAAVATARATEPEARELAQKFLAHMAGNSPIAGTFEIRQTYDLASLEEFRKKERAFREKKGQGVSFGPDKRDLNCRWAWDGSREMLETLPGSNVWETFFMTPEAHLRGTVKNNFNLGKQELSPVWRPASFYFLGGAAPWSALLKGCEFRIQDAPADAPSGCVALAATSKGISVNLVLNKATGILHGHKMVFADGKPYSELTIEEFKKNGDGRVFPVVARLLLFDPATGKESSRQILSAREISFPSSKAAVDGAFELILPKGTLINDLQLSQQITLKSPASALDVIDGKIPGEPAEFKLSEPATGTQTSPNFDAWHWWALAIAMSLPLGIYLAYRGYKMWKMRDAS